MQEPLAYINANLDSAARTTFVSMEHAVCTWDHPVFSDLAAVETVSLISLEKALVPENAWAENKIGLSE